MAGSGKRRRQAPRARTEGADAGRARTGRAGAHAAGAARTGAARARSAKTETAKTGDFPGSARRLLAQFRPERGRLLAMAAVSLVGVALSVSGPLILGRATDLVFAGVIGRSMPAGASREQVLEGMRAHGREGVARMLSGTDFHPGAGIDFTAVGGVLLTVLAIYAGAGLATLWSARLSVRAINRTVFRLRGRAQAKLSRLPLSYFDRQSRGEVLSRVTNDIDNISQTMQQTLGQMVTALLTIIGMLAMMLSVSWLLALVAVGTVPLSMLLARLVGKRAQPQFARQWASTGKLNGHIEESYTGHTLVRLFGRQRESAAAFREHNEELYRASFRAQFISGAIQPVMAFLGNVNYVLVAVVGALRVAAGALSIGDVQAFLQYSRQFSQPLTQLASMANMVQSGVASAERVFELLDAEEQRPEPKAAARPPELRGHIDFEHVGFRYEPARPLIEDLNLSVPPGRKVAIVGPTGAGKTTLVNLLLRFYEPDEGRIRLDGTDTAAMHREDLRSAFGMVLQDAWLFQGTIAENIAYGLSTTPEPEQIEQAARSAYADRFIRRLPEGYDTVLDDEGTSVSAGERQLITIARAFLSDPAILVLDEATSSVDTRTEVLIQQGMAELSRGRTSFVIAHRLSTIRDADVILVMEDGAIVEQGSHEKLLEHEGAYARLYAAQFAQAAGVTEAG